MTSVHRTQTKKEGNQISAFDVESFSVFDIVNATNRVLDLLGEFLFNINVRIFYYKYVYSVIDLLDSNGTVVDSFISQNIWRTLF